MASQWACQLLLVQAKAKRGGDQMFFQKLLNWLSPKPKRLARRWEPYTNPIDTNKIAKELQLKEEGARLGTMGVPLDTDTTLCAPELNAILAIEQARTDYIEWGQLRLKSLNSELTRLDVTSAINEGEDSAKEFERLAAVYITANAAEIKQLERVASSRQQAFDRFRAEHNRLDFPHYPQGAEKVALWMFALALVIVEALANMHFFAQGLSGGLLQGFTQAFLAAVVNVAVCLASGIFAIKFVHHVKPAKKLIGWASVLATMAFVLGLALVVAHYREALVKGLENAESAAFQSLLATPFSLTEVSSLYLILVSVVFGAVAAWDGYKLDDWYPGYGEEHRKTMAAAEAYRLAIDALHNKLDELKTTMISKTDYALSHSETAIISYKNVISDKDRCRDDLSNMIKDSPAMLNALLAEFRTENVLARRAAGHATPPSFGITPSLQELKAPNFDTTVDRVGLAKQQAQLDSFRSKAPKVRARIQSGYTSNFTSLHTLSSHFGGVSISSKIASQTPTSAASPVLATADGGQV